MGIVTVNSRGLSMACEGWTSETVEALKAPVSPFLDVWNRDHVFVVG